MWERFDFIAYICYTGYGERIRGIERELSRVGLLSRAYRFCDFPSPFTGLLAKIVASDDYHRELFKIGHTHYSAIKTAYETGRSSILVVEDDIRFLKDTRLIENALSRMPAKYELALLDKNFPIDEWKKFSKNNPPSIFPASGPRWSNFSNLLSSGCYAMSREGMAKFIAAYESYALRGRIKNADEFFNVSTFDGKLLFAAFPSIAIQGIIGRAGHCSPLLRYWENNEYQGGFHKMYNLDCPFVTKNNFIQELYSAVDRNVQKDAVKQMKKLRKIYCPHPPMQRDSVKCTSALGVFSDVSIGVPYNACIIWGHGTSNANLNSLQMALRDSCPVFLSEDGFIRSYTTWVDKSATPDQRVGYSVIFDDNAYYFDATRISNLERMLNAPSFFVTESQRKEARRLIDLIVSNKISKYNHQPIYTPSIGRKGVKKVLVIDQSYGDFSILKGMANDETFNKMLKTAIKENPEADILVKTHPDTLAGKKGAKKGYYQDIKEGGNVYKVTFPINIYSLMEICDKVYVCTSGVGMEALMAGKEVHTFGMPFYAGWGLTVDAQRLDRRTNKRTLEELFYIFYCLYTHWVDPDKGKETTIDAVIEKMKAMRDGRRKLKAPKASVPKVDVAHRTLSNKIFVYKNGTGVVSRPITFSRSHRIRKTRLA